MHLGSLVLSVQCKHPNEAHWSAVVDEFTLGDGHGVRGFT